jgi:MYXO-CTERM domain-containing protein
MLCALAFGAAVPARATEVDLGVFSLVTISSGDPVTAGVVGFEIDNYSGDQALPPDFPVFTSLTLTDLSLTYVVGGESKTVSVPDAGPGTSAAVPLPDTTLFDSASLTGVVDPATFEFADGTFWNVPGGGFIVELLPQAGTTLTPGVDFALIEVEADQVAPEPATAPLVLAGLGLVVLIRRR